MDNSAESITGRVRALRIRADLSMADFARSLGYRNASSVQRYENPSEYQGGYLKRDLVAKIESALIGKGSPPITKDEIWELAGPEFAVEVAAPIGPYERHAPNAKIGEAVKDSAVKIPVYGQAVGGLDGEFIMNGSVLFEVLAPPQIAKIAGAYGVQISGDSMYPRYEDGEIAFVDPRRRVKKGDYVVAQIQFDEHEPPHAYVKRFVSHNANELTLSQFNPMKTLTFEHDRVVSVHFIALAGIA